MGDQNQTFKTSASGDITSVTQAESIGTVEHHYHGVKSHEPPLQLPPRPDHFTGREEKIAGVIESLRLGHVVTLWGPGGIGKSAIASEVLWRITDSGNKFPEAFPEGIIWHDFYRTKETAKALEAIALAFGEDPRPTPLDAAKRALSGKKVLLLLDGAEDTDELPLMLEAAGTCGVIVTTRNQDDGENQREVETLPAEDAADLLRAFAREMADDQEAVRRICELAGNLPLALRLAGSYMAKKKNTALEYLAWMEETPLEALEHGKRKLQSVNVLLERSLDQVGDRAREILSIVGMMAFAPFRREMIAAALNVKIEGLRRPLDELTGYGLLLRPDGRYALSHALIHTYVREKHPPGAEAVERLMDFYADLAEKESQKGPAGYAILNPERPHILSLLGACAGEKACLPEACRGPGIWERVRKLVYAVDGYLDVCGYWMDRISALEAGIFGAQRSENRCDEGAFLCNLGNACGNLSQIEKTIQYHKQALVIARETGNRRREGNQTGNLGLAYSVFGQAEKAIQYHKQALVIAREIGNRQSEGTQLGNLGSAHYSLGQLKKAIGFYEQALIISREIEDRRGEGCNLGNLGSAYYSLGQLKKAIGFYEQALIISREIGDRKGEETWTGNLGLIYRNLGQAEKAIQYHKKALVIAKEIGDRRGEGSDLDNLGSAYYSLGQLKKAIGFYEQALIISREIGDRRGEGSSLGNLGLIYRDLGQAEKAIQYHKQALVIAKEIGDRQSEGTQLGNLGSAHYSLGQLKKAIGFYEQALIISREIGDREGEGIQTGNLGLAYRDIGQTEKAIGLYEKALTISREIGDRRSEGNWLGNLGDAYHVLGHPEKAIGFYEQALTISREIGDRRGEGIQTGSLGLAYRDLGHPEKAIGLYEQALTISKDIGYRQGAGTCLGNIAITYYSLGQYDKAIEFMEQALAIFEEIKSPNAKLARQQLAKWKP